MGARTAWFILRHPRPLISVDVLPLPSRARKRGRGCKSPTPPQPHGRSRPHPACGKSRYQPLCICDNVAGVASTGAEVSAVDMTFPAATLPCPCKQRHRPCDSMVTMRRESNKRMHENGSARLVHLDGASRRVLLLHSASLALTQRYKLPRERRGSLRKQGWTASVVHT